ncbi:hypothetical protein BGZ96_009850 [Linnemannia gamsii]|uniref:Tyrosine specific protein phosphatases domain-containing protein n=1 Tax=Linnemannia gamsii TaxID=64522 RepID=A0ABQ7JW15_9FUNG|nr:hypothetical protein BGZ96_009850 [Linnemannia gamsii]
MATFHSLSPSLGSHQSRLAPDLFSIELELELPQDHFLPAQDIQAQVWTNIIHKLNPDGPEVWAPIPMKLSHVIPGKSIAVFAARFQPTGRGDFGLTARWKSHQDMDEWQWAPTEVPITGEGNDKHQQQGSNLSAGRYDDEEGKKKTRDVSVTVRVPRTIAGTSSWTIGPQSVLVYGEHGLRTSGVIGVGGSGLYLGNHAAATRARISGYESVLSLVGDLLDFDENIPESDKDINKNAWMEQAQAASPPKKFSVLSRSSSTNALDDSEGGEGYPQQQTNSDQQGQGLTRRSSVTNFMKNYIPGSNAEDSIAGVVNEPVDPPRLTRKSSVTDMMVQPPSTSKRMSRSSASVSSIASIDEFDAETSTLPATATTAKANGSSLNKKASAASVTTPPTAPTSAATSGTATATAATHSSPAPPLSKKAQKAAAAAEKAAATTAATATPPTTAAAASNSSAALPPVSGNKSKTAATTGTTQGNSPTVSALAVTPVPTPTSTTPHPLESSSSTDNGFTSNLANHLMASSSSDTPPSSAKVVAGLYASANRQSSFDSSQILSSLASSEPLINGKKRLPFTHKVISVAPGAHSRISDAILREAVDFLQQELDEGKKVLVHCRDGNGRSGSVAVAYIACQLKKQQPWRKNDGGEIYQQALNEIWKWKCDVYPHKGLRQSVESMTP